MAIGDLVAQDAAAQGSLKALIRLKLREDRAVPWMKPDGYLRVSALSSMCAREEVLAAERKVMRRDLQEADLKMIFAHGTGIHHALQNIVLADIGALIGVWRCVDCAAQYGELNGPVGVSQTLVRCPYKCEKCGCHDMTYREQHFANDEYRLTGHPDGFLILPGMSGIGVVECKSISTRRNWEIKDTPDLGHAIQLQAYLWLTDLKWGKILYWDKGGHGVTALTEHTVERDEGTIDQIKFMIKSIRDGLEGGLLPKRICTTATCPRAKQCELVGPCFEVAGK